MSTRILKQILQNKVNREKIINQKKIYVENVLKNRQQNHNKIISRKMHSHSTNSSFGNGPNNNNNLFYMLIVASGVFVSSNIRKNKEKK